MTTYQQFSTFADEIIMGLRETVSDAVIIRLIGIARSLGHDLPAVVKAEADLRGIPTNNPKEELP